MLNSPIPGPTGSTPLIPASGPVLSVTPAVSSESGVASATTDSTGRIACTQEGNSETSGFSSVDPSATPGGFFSAYFSGLILESQSGVSNENAVSFSSPGAKIPSPGTSAGVPADASGLIDLIPANQSGKGPESSLLPGGGEAASNCFCVDSWSAAVLEST